MPTATTSQTTPARPLPSHVRVAIIGAGFGGLGAAIRLDERGEDFVVLERAEDVGGTWQANTYPGCTCDVPSHLYSFSFARNPNWSLTYSRQPEIYEYLRRTADEFGVMDRVHLGCEVTAAVWEDESQRWRLDTSEGSLTADFVIAAPGGLSEPRIPDIPGLDSFKGKVFHSARWDHDHDLTGDRVAVVGTGASSIQFVPRIQPKVGRLHLFQRTPPWIMPHTNRRVSNAERRAFRRVPGLQRLVRSAIYWSREWVVLGLAVNRRFLWPLERIARRHLAASVSDPDLRRKLTPNYKIGCKRILVSNDYLPSLAKPNVEVVSEGISEIRESSVVATDGTEREVDTIIFGTGFSIQDLPMAHHLRGREGRSLAEAWSGSMQAHRGTTVAGFPNLFFLLGPNTGLGHTSVVFMIEQQIEYVLAALRTTERRRAAVIEVRPEAQAAFNDELQERLGDTVWSQGGCASWYTDANGRNTTLWPGFTFEFRHRMRRFDKSSYVLQAPAPAGDGERYAAARA